MSSAPMLPFSHSVFPVVQLASLRDFGDWTPSACERAAYPLLPDIASYRDGFDVPELEKLWPEIAPHTMLDVFRVGSIVQRFDECLSRPGDVFECGTGPGGLSLLLAKIIQARGLDKKVWVFDSFEGLPPPNRAVDREYQAGACAYSLPRVQALMESHGVMDVVRLRKGWLSETLPELAPGQRFCFGYVDVDLYSSIMDAIEHTYDRIEDGCALVFDDYLDGSGGAFRAVNEAARDRGETVQLGPTCQAFWIKGSVPAGSCRVEGWDGAGHTLDVPASISYLQSLVGYHDFLDQMHSVLQTEPLTHIAENAEGVFPKDVPAILPSLDAYLRMCRRQLVPERLPLEPAGTLTCVNADSGHDVDRQGAG